MMSAPAFAQAATDLIGHTLLCKVTGNGNPRIASAFGIRSIPVKAPQIVSRADQSG